MANPDVVSAGRCGLIGRERELALLDALVATAADGGGAAAVLGEAGIGKTALLRRVAARAAARPLWIRGTPPETALPFAAVADLLLPLQPCFARLPAVQQEALEISLALRGGAPPSPLAVCAAALGVLGAAAAEQPLLVVVDDLQWVDPSSRQVLLFVARRLANEHVVMLLASRDGPDDPVLPDELASVALAGLTTGQCAALASSRQVAVSPSVLAGIAERCGGNPLGVLETLAAMSPEARQGADPDGPPLGATLHRHWAGVIDRLPAATRTALVVVAASRSGAIGDVEPVLGTLGGSFADLAPAERLGLIGTRDGELVLRHPLVRSVILDHAPLGVRLRTHRALAAHATGPQRSWYLAAAATGPDAGVASDLAAAALAVRGRGDHHTAARTWRRAADLTPDPGVRAQRLLAAATDAHVAGKADLAQAWCEEAMGLDPDPAFVADVELVRGRATTRLGHPLRAVDDLVRAGDAVAALDGRRAARLWAEAALPALLANRVDTMLEVTGRAATRARDDGRSRTVAGTTLRAVALVLSGRAEQGREQLDAVAGSTAETGPPWEAEFVVLQGHARVWLEDYDAARPLLSSVLDGARRLGAASILSPALAARAELDWWTGAWASACADATEALHWAVELRQAAAVGLALTTLGRIDASRGEVAVCRERMDRALREIGPYRLDRTLVQIDAVLGLAALGVGDLDLAVHHLGRAGELASGGGMHATNAVPLDGDLVEALVRAGRCERAREVLDRLESRAACGGLAHPAAAAARCRGLLADDPDVALAHFARARGLHDAVRAPFERARTLLCEAETLRRLRRPAAARPALREALAAFDALGARPWAARAEAELAATGARPGARRPGPGVDLAVLTPQEFQIARAVAGGLNNAEAAAALFVSRKTVEAHLTRVYRKLDIRSRTELVRCFGPADPEPVRQEPAAALRA